MLTKEQSVALVHLTTSAHEGGTLSNIRTMNAQAIQTTNLSSQVGSSMSGTRIILFRIGTLADPHVFRIGPDQQIFFDFQYSK